jgi:hypothetical protein
MTDHSSPSITVNLLEIKRADLLEVEMPTNSTVHDLKLEISRVHGYALPHMRLMITRDNTPSFCPDASTLLSLGITSSEIVKLYAKGVHRPPVESDDKFPLAPVPQTTPPRRSNLLASTARTVFGIPSDSMHMIWREMSCISRYQLTVEDAMGLYLLTFRDRGLYEFILTVGAPIWKYIDRMSGLFEIADKKAIPQPWFSVQHVTIFQDFLLDSVEHRDKMMNGDV